MRLSRHLLTKIIEINLFSTVYLNFIMFPFSKAIRFPILIFGKVTIKNVRKGRLVFNCPLTTGILQIGKRSLGFLDKLQYGMWQGRYMYMVKLQLVKGVV